MRYNQFLPYWSKVAQLTVHTRTNKDHTSSHKSKAPVTQIDLALFESFIRQINFGGLSVPKTSDQAFTITEVYPDGDNWNYVFEQEKEKEALIKHLVGRLKISGNVDRDLKAINKFSSTA